MRKRKPESKLKPYLLGIAFGYAAMLITVLPAALILSLMKTAAKGAGAAAVIALMAGGFICGKTGGLVRQRDGLKTGFLCGLMFAVPLVALSVIFGGGFSGSVFLKLALCTSFATVGGVSGVNSRADN